MRNEKDRRRSCFINYLYTDKHCTKMECNRNMRVEKTNSIKWKLIDTFSYFEFGRKIKMDFMVFLVFAVLTNYCFIDGCRSKETSVKISVQNDLDGILKKTKSAESIEPANGSFESNSLNTAYQIPVMYPYPYPVPAYPAANPGTIEYDRSPEIFQSQNTQFIEVIPQTQPGSTLINSNQPQPVIPQPASVGVRTESYGPYQPGNISPTSQDQNIQTVLVNPIPAQSNNRQDFISSVSVSSVAQSDYYQPGFGRPPPQYNPCQNKQCRPGSKCVVRRNPSCPRCPLTPVCVDPCETVRCASGYICKSEVGQCGTPFCEPRAICKDPCQGITCPGNDNCTLISLPCTTSCDPVPICGRDPCETTTCPLGQGCYLQEHFCQKPPCRVDAVCRDPCIGIVCGPNEFCYTEDVTCIKAPCNPIPFCKNPCASLTCPFGQHCELEQAFCIRTPCNPIATCKPN